MTSKLTRERLQEIAEDGFLKHGESKELARIALAAMDSKPVAVVEPSDYVTAAQLVGDGPARKAVHELYEGALRIGDKLYRHAQPAPTIEPVQMFGIGSIFKPHVVSQQEANCDDCAHYNSEICHGEGCPAISQQSAQPAPVVNEDLYKLANHIASSKNGLPDEWQDWAEELETDIRRAAMLQAGNFQSSLKIDHESTFIKHVKAVSEKARAGNSPVIPDGWIPVRERMPEDAQWCLVNTEYGYHVQCWSKGQGWLGDECSIPNCDVTHWMPLPAAPQEVTGE